MAMSDDRPLTDLERLQLQANNVADESLASTRRMREMCVESQDAGAKTLDMLNHQAEQLNRADQGLDAVNSELREAERHVTGMEKWCGLCVCPWNRASKIRDKDGVWINGQKDIGPISNQPQRNQPANSGRGPSSGPYIQRITNDSREDEMEENMQEVGGMLSNLKNMAQEMGSEVERQNKQLDRMKDKSESVNVRVDHLNKRTEDLLK